MQPARSVIDKCGGAAQTAYLAGCGVGWVYRWVMPSSAGGTGGRIPARAREKLLKAARAGVVPLTPLDFEEGWT